MVGYSSSASELDQVEGRTGQNLVFGSLYKRANEKGRMPKSTDVSDLKLGENTEEGVRRSPLTRSQKEKIIPDFFQLLGSYTGIRIH